MKLSEITKTMIREEYDSFVTKMYAGKTKQERKALGQFFTPPEYTIKMIEMLPYEGDISQKTVLDPCCGSGNLLIGCLIAGFSANNIYGNDFDPTMVQLCRDRLEAYVRDYCGVLPHDFNIQIHWGDALVPKCLTQFDSDYTYDPMVDVPVVKKSRKKVA